MSRTLVGLSVGLAAMTLAACARPAPPEPPPATTAVTTGGEANVAVPASQAARKTLQITELGLRLDLPLTWTVEAGADGHRLRPPAGDPAAAAVWLLQAQRTTRAGGTIDNALALKAGLLDELKQIDPAGKLLRTLAHARDGVEGVRLETLFTRDQVTWRKDQLLLDRGDQVLVLSVAAPDARYAPIVETWESLLASLRFDPVALP